MSFAMEINYKFEDLESVANQLLEKFSHKTVLFYGAMGLGKTTLIKALAKALNCKDDISSPTYSIVNEYALGNNQKIYHFDFYRIETIQEALDFGVDDYLYSGQYVFIEWPEVILELLPEGFDTIHIQQDSEDSRTLILKP